MALFRIRPDIMRKARYTATICLIVLTGLWSFAGEAHSAVKNKRDGARAAGSNKGSADISPKQARAPITITSDKLEIDKGTGHVLFSGNVAATEDFTICSDELMLVYGKTKEISELAATGNVRIFHKDKSAVAQKASYDRKNRTVVLTGSPEVSQCSDTVKGDRITVKLDEDNAFVESDGGKRVRAVIMPVKNCQGAAVAQKGPGEEALCKGTR